MRWLTLTLLFALAAPAAATTVRQVSLPQLVADADVAVVGWIVARESRWDGTRIKTYATLEVEEVLRGDVKEPTLELVTLGGIVGDIGQHVAGAPTYPVGQHLAVLLKRTPDGRYYAVGLWQGVFVLTNAPQSPTPIERPTEGSHTLPSPNGPPPPGDLETLRRIIREVPLR